MFYIYTTAMKVS